MSFILLFYFSVGIACTIILTYCSYYLLMKHISNNKVNWKQENKYEKISLIVATYNEASTLPKKLDNIIEQDYPKDLMELVFVDSASTDATGEIIADFIKCHPERKIVFIREKERLGKSHALNVAYAKASGEIKIISDADSLLDDSALTTIMRNFSDSRIGAASGRQILLNSDQTPSTRFEKSYRDIYLAFREGESILDSTPIFDGELCGYRSDLIESLPEGKSGDDSRLANVVRKKGYRAVFDSTAVYYEYSPPDFRSKWIQKVRRGQGLIRLLWDFRSCLFRRKYGTYGLFILPMEFLMHCVFPSLFVFSIVASTLSLVFINIYIAILGLILLGLAFALTNLKANNSLFERTRNIFSLALSFLSMELYLFYGLLLTLSGKSLHKWKKVDAVRKEFGNSVAHS